MLPFLLVYLFIFNGFVNLSTGLPQGAPESVCYTMLPNHAGGIQPQQTASPFRIETSSQILRQGQTIRVEIQSNPPELNFGGFMIHATSTTPPYQVVGRLAPSSDNTFRLINCNGEENTATHTSPTPKNDLGLEWQAPYNFVGFVVFNATVAQTYSEFWTGITSQPIEIVAAGASIPPQIAGISTTRNPISPTVPVYVPETIRPQQRMDPIYDGCSSTKTCFGFPDGCVGQQSCRAIITANVRGDRYEFEMKSGYNNPAYIAIGLSADDKMGDDSIMECIPESGTIRAYTSWTNPRPNLGVTRDGVPQNIVRLIDGSHVDGTIYCKIERQATSMIKGVSFDLQNDKYNLLVAIGSSLKENSVGYHDLGKLAASQPRALADVSDVAGASNILLRLHGAFMLTAWIGTASVGILLARYFKQTWVGSQLCGKDQWFAWHRTCMILTWSLTMAAFVIIFVQIGGWSSEQNPHAILGTLTTILCFIQPIGALFRPAPNHKNRPYFNWIHWFIGNLAHLLAIVTIFFAVKLTKAELPEWFDWILVAYVAFHVLMHIIFSISGCLSDKTYNERVTTFPMTDVSATRGGVTVRKVDAPFSGLRKILLTIYLVILILLVVTLVVVAVLAPIEDTVQSFKTKLMN